MLGLNLCQLHARQASYCTIVPAPEQHFSTGFPGYPKRATDENCVNDGNTKTTGMKQVGMWAQSVKDGEILLSKLQVHDRTYIVE